MLRSVRHDVVGLQQHDADQLEPCSSLRSRGTRYVTRSVREYVGELWTLEGPGGLRLMVYGAIEGPLTQQA